METVLFAPSDTGYSQVAASMTRTGIFKGSRSRLSAESTGGGHSRRVLEMSAIRKGVWPVEETGESIAAVEALSADDNLSPTLVESIVIMTEYVQDDMWLILDFALGAVLIARLYFSFSHGLVGQLSAEGIQTVRSLDDLSAVSGVLLVAGR